MATTITTTKNYAKHYASKFRKANSAKQIPQATKHKPNIPNTHPTMKHYLRQSVMVALLLTSCYHAHDPIAEPEPSPITRNSRAVTIQLGTWEGSQSFGYDAPTRASLLSSAMTDLWLYDYDADGTLLQSLHITPSDAQWPSPTLTMTYGEHILRAIASRGTGTTVTDGRIAWAKPHDTFSTAQSVDVSDRSDDPVLTLRRSVARLTVTLDDALPADCSTLALTLARRSQAMLLPSLVGDALGESTAEVDVTTARGMAGVSVNLYSLCPTTEWITTLLIEALDADGVLISEANVAGVTLMQGTTTNVHGRLFCAEQGISIALDDAWGEAIEREF